jgi:hypothetical protein
MVINNHHHSGKEASKTTLITHTLDALRNYPLYLLNGKPTVSAAPTTLLRHARPASAAAVLETISYFSSPSQPLFRRFVAFSFRTAGRCRPEIGLPQKRPRRALAAKVRRDFL